MPGDFKVLRIFSLTVCVLTRFNFTLNPTLAPTFQNLGINLSLPSLPFLVPLATARGYTDTTVRIEAGSNEEVTLPTAVVFEKAGSCGITPEITEARLRYEPDMNILFHCMTRDCVVNNQTRYEFLTFGDVTLVPPDVLPGQYLMALIQMCPDLILRMTYNVIFTNGRK